MKILVTGAAGFIGSHLTEKILENPENEVIGIDCLIGPTPGKLKTLNLQTLKHQSRFTFHQENLLDLNLTDLLQGVDVVFHLAAIPGVRSSWGCEFEPYVFNNILATQRLLEACIGSSVKKFVFASTSSVYGDKSGQVSEDMELTPLSPYGATKLTGETMCKLYRENFGLPLVVLRYFTVYGPRQRPDMAFHRFIKQIILGETLTIFGDGNQTRDFTYIDDCILGTTAVLEAENVLGETINIGGNEQASILEIIAMLENISNKKAKISFQQKVKGEPRQTWANIEKAKNLLSYSPRISLYEGLQKEFLFLSSVYKEGDL